MMLAEAAAEASQAWGETIQMVALCAMIAFVTWVVDR